MGETWRMVEDVGGVAVLVDLSNLTSQGGGVWGYVWLGVRVRGGKGVEHRTRSTCTDRSPCGCTVEQQLINATKVPHRNKAACAMFCFLQLHRRGGLAVQNPSWSGLG